MQKSLKYTRIRVGIIDAGFNKLNPSVQSTIEKWKFFNEEGILEKCSVLPKANLDHGDTICSTVLGMNIYSKTITCNINILLGIAIESGWVVLRIMRALMWLLTEKVDVILLPLGIESRSPVFEPLLIEAQNLNILIIAAIGNCGSGKVSSPASSDYVLSVGTHDSQGRPAKFSGSAPGMGLECRFPLVLAPGVDFEFGSEFAKQKYSGTSLSAAYVARYAAILKSEFPDVSARHLKQAIISSANFKDKKDLLSSRYGNFDFNEARKYLSILKKYNFNNILESITPKTVRYIDRRIIAWAKFRGGQIPSLVRWNSDYNNLDKTVNSKFEPADGFGTLFGILDSKEVLELADNENVALLQCADTGSVILAQQFWKEIYLDDW